MDFGCGGSAGGSGGGDESGQGTSGSGGIKRKWDDFETTMKAMKDALVKECEEKSAQIRKLMEENVRLKQDNLKLEETVLRLENLPFQKAGGVVPLVARPDPFDVFPPEVWEVIIEKITRCSDLEAFCLAFPQLKQMAKKLKNTVFLFEKVIPLVSKHLGWKDIYNCRLVCDKWNQDLCALLENSHAPKPNASSHGDLTSKPSLPYCGPTVKFSNAYNFENPTKIQRFLDKMSDHPGNPCFGRFLRVFYGFSRTESGNFWKSAIQLVEKFGEHVWSFEMIYHQDFGNLIKFYEVLQQLIVYLPNLRELEVVRYNGGQGGNEDSINMAAQFGSCPLPPLPYLQSLKLALDGEMELMNAFTPYFSNQIHHLELGEKTLSDVNLKVESLRGLINLQYLEVELRSKQDILRLLEFPTANLKKLRLHSMGISAPLDSDSFNLEQFASLSEKFSRLEHLDLTLCTGKLSSFLGSRIRLTGLKTLEIEVEIGKDVIQHDLDFILRLSSLQHLVIVIEFMGRTDNDEYDEDSTLKIRKYLYGGDMLDSNIWTLMPTLQLLECCGDHEVDGIYPKANGVFTRAMFENRVG